jgi:predicted nucleotidyltransferase
MREFSISLLQEALHRHDKILFSILFGSSQGGVLIKDDADIDIAVYLAEKPSPDMLAEIVGLVQDTLQYDAVDLIILNTSDPLLAFEALSGKLLTCRDDEAYASFFSRICRQYEDEMIRIQKCIAYHQAAAPRETTMAVTV